MIYIVYFFLTSWSIHHTGNQCSDIQVFPVTDTLTYELPSLQAARNVFCTQLQNIGTMGGEGKVLTGIKLDSNLVQP